MHQRAGRDDHPEDVERRRGQGAVPEAVHDEARRAEQVHPLKGAGPAGQPSRRHQQIGREDQQGAGPAERLDGECGGAQAARFLST